jgi:hypothetical protein
MNLLVKMSIVPIFFLPLTPGWAGTQEEAKVIEQPSVNTTEPWEITVGGPGWLAGVTGTTGFMVKTPMWTSESGKFSGISTLFIRSAAKFAGGGLVF